MSPRYSVPEPCAHCGTGIGKAHINGVGLLCYACWDKLAPPATAGRLHELSQRDQELERQFQELDRKAREPMVRCPTQIVPRSCSHCGGAVQWQWEVRPVPAGWEGACLNFAHSVMAQAAA